LGCGHGCSGRPWADTAATLTQPAARALTARRRPPRRPVSQVTPWCPIPHYERVRVSNAADLQRRAVAAADEGRTGTARKLFRSALQHESDPVGRARILISLAFYEAERDGPAAGLALLSGADDTNELPRWMHGLVLGQRALIQLRAGDPPAAMKDFDGAARLLTEHHPE